MVFEKLPHPLIFAHRGSSAHAPENTISAFQMAVSQGAPAIELDAKCSADGVVFVIHDASVERTTNGQGNVANLTSAELKRLDAGSKFSTKFAGESIPTLAEVFEVVGGKLLINVELTNYTTPRDSLVDKVVDLVRLFKLQGSVLFSSFDIENLNRAHQIAPEIPLGFLTRTLRAWLALINPPDFPYAALHPHVLDAVPWIVDNAHRSDRCVYVWTVNQPAWIPRLIKMGVDGFFTDDPLLALETVGSAT